MMSQLHFFLFLNFVLFDVIDLDSLEITTSFIYNLWKLYLRGRGGEVWLDQPLV